MERLKEEIKGILENKFHGEQFTLGKILPEASGQVPAWSHALNELIEEGYIVEELASVMVGNVRVTHVYRVRS